MRAGRQMTAEKRLLIVEEALKDRRGHWYEYDKAVRSINAARGVSVVVAAHQSVAPEIMTELNAAPVFRYTNWDQIYYSARPFKRYWGVLVHNWRVWRAMDRFLKDSEPFDHIFVPTVAVFHLAAWFFLCMRHKNKKFKRLTLLFRNNAGRYVAGQSRPVFKRSSYILRQLLRSFGPWVRDGAVCLATDSSRLSAEYTALCGLPFQTFPHALIRTHTATVHLRKSGDPVVLACLGPARLEKGIDLLEKAVRLLLDRKPELNVRYVIQWNQELRTLDGGRIEPDSGLVKSGRVDYLTRELSSDEYDRQLLRADCMVLPYRRESYCARISGVALEAMAAGIPLIYTRDTWMEDAVLAHGAGLAVEDESAEDLADKITEMVSRADEFRAAAARRSAAAVEHHSPERLMAALWGGA